MCEICRQSPCNSRCPNYEESEISNLICDICGEYIFRNEEYISRKKLYAHLDCFDSPNEVLDWLEYPIHINYKGGFYED